MLRLVNAVYSRFTRLFYRHSTVRLVILSGCCRTTLLKEHVYLFVPSPTFGVVSMLFFENVQRTANRRLWNFDLPACGVPFSNLGGDHLLPPRPRKMQSKLHVQRSQRTIFVQFDKRECYHYHKCGTRG